MAKVKIIAEVDLDEVNGFLNTSVLQGIYKALREYKALKKENTTYTGYKNYNHTIEIEDIENEYRTDK